uniref:Uncharacterized protein n=1 Tax=Octopus bimaculoides TaxID=37653 RepID=A0A0L8HM75_OCTBM
MTHAAPVIPGCSYFTLHVSLRTLRRKHQHPNFPFISTLKRTETLNLLLSMVWRK